MASRAFEPIRPSPDLVEQLTLRLRGLLEPRPVILGSLLRHGGEDPPAARHAPELALPAIREGQA